MANRGSWRASYTPGQWVVLTGPTSLVVLGRRDDLQHLDLTSIAADVSSADTFATLTRHINSWPVDVSPELLVFVEDDALRCAVRGELQVKAADSGAVVADGRSQVAWQQYRLEVRQIRVDLERPDPARARWLPLALDQVNASIVAVDARGGLDYDFTTSFIPDSLSTFTPPPGFAPAGTEQPGTSILGSDIFARAESLLAQVGGAPEAPLDPAASVSPPAPLLDQSGGIEPPDVPFETGLIDEPPVPTEASSAGEAPAPQPQEWRLPEPEDEPNEASGASDTFTAPPASAEQWGEPVAPDLGIGEPDAAPSPYQPPAAPHVPFVAQVPSYLAAAASDVDAAPSDTAADAAELAQIMDATTPEEENPAVAHQRIRSQLAEPELSMPEWMWFQPPEGAEDTAVVDVGDAAAAPLVDPIPPTPVETPAAEPEPAARPRPQFNPDPRAAVLVISDGRVFGLEKPVIIGRAPKAPSGEDLALIKVASPQHDVSRSHVRIEAQADGILITDLESTNGTMVRGPRIGTVVAKANQPVLAPLGSMVSLGDEVLVRVQPRQVRKS